jgi:outer membrane protein assembly factor BamA
MMRLLVALLLAGAWAPGRQQPSYPIHKLSVEGNSRLKAEAILRAAGFELEQKAVPADFDAACTRLMETGLFQSVQYRYKPAEGTADPGFDLTLQVVEAQDFRPARIEIPEVRDADLWAWLAENEPLVARDVPSNEAAERYYAAAIERYLAAKKRSGQVIAKRQVDRSADMVIVFRPAVLPKIVELRFEGNRAVSSEALGKALGGPALGSEYAEPAFRELLDLLVRPMYEELGRLRVAFPAIAVDKRSADALSVTVMIDEGEVYQLGDIQVACDGIPEAELVKVVALKPGEVADWKRISAALGRMQAVLARYGYLQPSEQVDRAFDDEAHRVSLIVSIQKGARSVFGELRLSGLKPEAEARARKIWRLDKGEPMDMAYVDQYLKHVAADAVVRRSGFTSVGRRIQPRPEGNVVDVEVEFQ